MCSVWLYCGCVVYSLAVGVHFSITLQACKYNLAVGVTLQFSSGYLVHSLAEHTWFTN